MSLHPDSSTNYPTSLSGWGPKKLSVQCTHSPFKLLNFKTNSVCYNNNDTSTKEWFSLSRLAFKDFHPSILSQPNPSTGLSIQTHFMVIKAENGWMWMNLDENRWKWMKISAALHDINISDAVISGQTDGDKLNCGSKLYLSSFPFSEISVHIYAEIWSI